MKPRKVSQDPSAPALPAAQPTPDPEEGVGRGKFAGISLVMIGVGCLVLAICAIWFVVYQTRIKPQKEFNPQTETYVFERDALEDSIPVVSMQEIFSEEKIKRYEHGDGFTATFRILNDPRKNYAKSEEAWSLETWTNFVQALSAGRREFVKAQRPGFEAAVARFQNSIPVPRSVEIGLDDTEGVDERLRGWVIRSLTGLEEELMSPKDTTKFFVFRLTDADYLNYREFTVLPGDKEAAKKAVREGLGWLLEPRHETKESSVATGLFNAIGLNRDVRKRQVLVFSDGMENSPATVSFYPVVRNLTFLDKSNWEILDKAISRFEDFPDLRWARVQWFFPPQRGVHFRAVARYWEHVFRERCQAKEVETIY